MSEPLSEAERETLACVATGHHPETCDCNDEYAEPDRYCEYAHETFARVEQIVAARTQAMVAERDNTRESVTVMTANWRERETSLRQQIAHEAARADAEQAVADDACARAEAAEAEVERLKDMARRSRQMSRVWSAEERAEAAEAERDRLRKGIEAIAAAPDGTTWVEVEPYMDPPNEDECVEVRFADVERLRALLRPGGVMSDWTVGIVTQTVEGQTVLRMTEEQATELRDTLNWLTDGEA